MNAFGKRSIAANVVCLSVCVCSNVGDQSERKEKEKEKKADGKYLNVDVCPA